MRLIPFCSFINSLLLLLLLLQQFAATSAFRSYGGPPRPLGRRTVSAEEALPVRYTPEEIDARFDAQKWKVAGRILQVVRAAARVKLAGGSDGGAALRAELGVRHGRHSLSTSLIVDVLVTFLAARGEGLNVQRRAVGR